ncbi:MAG: signal recognition particle-docking protein FtsY [Pseudomonadota bacterium]
MFGSHDDKKTPAGAGEPLPGDSAEKKSLFGWMRKKPQDAPSAAPEPRAADPVSAPPAPGAEPVTPLAADLATPAPAASPSPAPLATAQYPLTSQVASPAALAQAQTPAAPPAAPNPAPVDESKSLFGWMRKKPQDSAPVAIAPQPAPASAEAVGPAVSAPLPTPAVLQAPVVEPVPAADAAPVDAAAEIVGPTVEPITGPTALDTLPGASAKPGMFGRLLGAAPEPALPASEPIAPAPVAEKAAAPLPGAEDSKIGFFTRLKQGLSKTSASLGEGMASLFLGRKVIDDELFDEIETRLLTADVGVEATSLIIQHLTQRVARKQLTDSGALYKALQEELTALLRPVEKPLVIGAEKKPFVILVVGVNGAGKTTTIGKLAKKLQLEGKKVMLAAGDTFRAAAVEQLQVWGERNQIAVIAQHTGADSASVIFDAVQAATARGMDVLIADTAGRLHTKDNLMEELKKVRRVIGKLDDTAPHEVLLVLDAGTGQNAINQAKQFHQTVSLTGLALTKLDGTAKGGVIFALAKQFGLPIRYIGVGEGIDDLRTFEAESFVQALFAEQERP